MNKSKRGQITLFIIVGLVIVFAVIFLLYIRNISLFFQPSKVIPEDVEPIKNLIEQCLEDSAVPLIDHMMFHSGYTKTDLLKFPTSDDYFQLVENTDFKIPYDLPKGTAENPRKGMEQSLKRDIQVNIKKCIDFTKFEQFNIIEKNPELTVKINDEDVTLSLKYSLEIINKQTIKKTKLLDFKKIIQTKLGKLSDLARAIMNQEDIGIRVTDVTDSKGKPMERTIHFLEEMTLDILRSNSNEVFPLEGIEFNTKKREWKIKDLKKSLKERLRPNLICITYKGTASENLLDSCKDPCETNPEYFPCSNREIEDYSLYYQRFSIPVTTDLKYKNTNVELEQTFTSNWKFSEFSVNKKKNDEDIVKPIKPVKIPYVGDVLKLYHHLYNIKYPILFKLSEGNDIFQFATPVIIEKNRANREAKFFFISTSFTSEDFCEDKEIPLNVRVKDTFNNLLKDVDIKFQCANLECEIGKTQPKYIGNVKDMSSIPELETEVPFCSNAVLVADKEGYQPISKTIFKNRQYSDPKQKEFVTIENMIPLKKFDYEFTVLDYSTGIVKVRDLKNDEVVSITLLNKETDDYKTISYSPDPDLDLKEDLELMVSDYKYDLRISVIKNENITGGFEYEWQPSLIKLDYGENIMFYVFVDSNIDSVESSAEFWQNTVQIESKKPENQPKIT